jgi:predicted regulator of Ras-like GTPase activity (Roadblock/LC7/MglB family)
MTDPTTQPDTDFLLTNFTEEVADVTHAIAVSADGLLRARSAGLPRDRADQLAAVAAGLASLTHGAADLMEAGTVRQNIVEMDGGFLLLMSTGDTGALVALAGRDCDVGHVGYAMALLVEKVGSLLEPEPRIAAAVAA